MTKAQLCSFSQLYKDFHHLSAHGFGFQPTNLVHTHQTPFQQAAVFIEKVSDKLAVEQRAICCSLFC